MKHLHETKTPPKANEFLYVRIAIYANSGLIPSKNFPRWHLQKSSEFKICSYKIHFLVSYKENFFFFFKENENIVILQI